MILNNFKCLSKAADASPSRYKYWIYYLYEKCKHRYTPLDGLPEMQLRVTKQSSRVHVYLVYTLSMLGIITAH